MNADKRRWTYHLYFRSQTNILAKTFPTDLKNFDTENLYLKPKLEHWEIWPSPHLAWVWPVKARGLKQSCSVAAFWSEPLKQYEEI